MAQNYSLAQCAWVTVAKSPLPSKPLNQRYRVYVSDGLHSTISSMLKVGSEGLYEWLVSDQQFDLLQLCPEIALWKYIAITSFDSGPLVLTNEEIAP